MLYEVITDAVADVFDFRPKAIIERLGLRNAIYTPTAAYGHFGRQPETRVPDAGATASVITSYSIHYTKLYDGGDPQRNLA